MNGGLIRVDPSYQCITVVLNNYTIVVITITPCGLGNHFVVYKSALGIRGQIKDLQFLHNCVIPTMALVIVPSSLLLHA